MSRISLALVGAGKWGRNYIKAAEDSGEATVSRIIGRGEDIPRDVDAVVVATHPRVSPERCIEAFALGLPVMVEKPAALSVAEALRIKLHAAAKRCMVLVNHQHLFAEGFEALRAMGLSPHGLHVVFSGPTERDYPASWDYGPHAVSALLALGWSHGGPFHPYWYAGRSLEKHAFVRHDPPGSECTVAYSAYKSQAEPPLTRSVRAFARAVKSGGTDDYRFGAHWAADVARVLEAAESPKKSPD